VCSITRSCTMISRDWQMPIPGCSTLTPLYVSVDMSVQNCIGDSFRGATWVALHNGGGVGWGEVMNGGFGLVLDGSENAAKRAQCMLQWDVSNGVSAEQLRYDIFRILFFYFMIQCKHLDILFSWPTKPVTRWPGFDTMFVRHFALFLLSDSDCDKRAQP